MACIDVDGVSKSFTLPDGGTRTALSRIDLRVAAGEFLALLGPSGCGKTTLLNILSGLDGEYEGRVRFGQNGDWSSRWPRFSYMFQESRLLPWLTVGENLRFVLDERKGADELIADWLHRVGLDGAGSLYPAQLSVGMQQRVSLIRALMVDPEVLFMDEPLSALDELTASQMRDELLSLWMESKATVVFVTHSPVEAVYLADRVLIMSPRPGSVVADLNVGKELPRPRDAEDTRVWELSRECVRILRGESPPTTPS